MPTESECSEACLLGASSAAGRCTCRWQWASKSLTISWHFHEEDDAQVTSRILRCEITDAITTHVAESAS